MIIKRLVIIFTAVFLLSSFVCAQEDGIKKNTDQVLLQKEVEKYLNDICSSGRLSLNSVIKKIDPSGKEYIRLNEYMSVVLIIHSSEDCGALYCVDPLDPTKLRDVIMYITSGYFLMLENEAELAVSIAHELGHLSFLNDRFRVQDITEEESLKSEMAADKIGILVAKEMGYKPEALVELHKKIFGEYSDKVHQAWSKEETHRFLVIKKLVKEIYEAEPENKDKYKEYLYFTEAQFKDMKKIVKYLQDTKSGN